MFDFAKFLKLDEYFEKIHDKSFEILGGAGKVMISAPHSVSQTRNECFKRAEPQTGDFAIMLHDQLNIPVIYKLANLNDDANFDEISDYKTALSSYIKDNDIKLVIDLHQLSQKRVEGVGICTGGLKNVSDLKIINIILKAFTERDFGVVQIDEPFKGSSKNTVSSFISKNNGISAVQLEINSRLLWPFDRVDSIKAVYNALYTIVKECNELL